MRIIRMRGKDVAHADACRCIHCCEELLGMTLAQWTDPAIPFPKTLDATIYVKAHWRRGNQNRLMRERTKKYFRTKVIRMKVRDYETQG